MPPEGELILEWFHDLAGLHTSGMSVNPLQPSEIEAYFRLVGEEPTPWEVRTLLRMDHAFLDRITKPKRRAGNGLDVAADDGHGVVNLMRSFRGRKPNPGLKTIDLKAE